MARIALALPGIALAGWLVSLGAVLRWERNDEARVAGAIVVLGAAQYVGHPSPVLRARLDHAIALWQRKLAPRMIMTGGTGTGDTTSEAAVIFEQMAKRIATELKPKKVFSASLKIS